VLVDAGEVVLGHVANQYVGQGGVQPITADPPQGQPVAGVAEVNGLADLAQHGLSVPLESRTTSYEVVAGATEPYDVADGSGGPIPIEPSLDQRVPDLGEELGRRHAQSQERESKHPELTQGHVVVA
jgi:hypothetical protein